MTKNRKFQIMQHIVCLSQLIVELIDEAESLGVKPRFNMKQNARRYIHDLELLISALYKKNMSEQEEFEYHKMVSMHESILRVITSLDFRGLAIVNELINQFINGKIKDENGNIIS